MLFPQHFRRRRRRKERLELLGCRFERIPRDKQLAWVQLVGSQRLPAEILHTLRAKVIHRQDSVAERHSSQCLVCFVRRSLVFELNVSKPHTPRQISHQWLAFSPFLMTFFSRWTWVSWYQNVSILGFIIYSAHSSAPKLI